MRRVIRAEYFDSLFDVIGLVDVINYERVK